MRGPKHRFLTHNRTLPHQPLRNLPPPRRPERPKNQPSPKQIQNKVVGIKGAGHQNELEALNGENAQKDPQ